MGQGPRCVRRGCGSFSRSPRPLPKAARDHLMTSSRSSGDSLLAFHNIPAPPVCRYQRKKPVLFLFFVKEKQKSKTKQNKPHIRRKVKCQVPPSRLGESHHSGPARPEAIVVPDSSAAEPSRVPTAEPTQCPPQLLCSMWFCHGGSPGLRPPSPTGPRP